VELRNAFTEITGFKGSPDWPLRSSTGRRIQPHPEPTRDPVKSKPNPAEGNEGGEASKETPELSKVPLAVLGIGIALITLIKGRVTKEDSELLRPPTQEQLQRGKRQPRGKA